MLKSFILFLICVIAFVNAEDTPGQPVENQRELTEEEKGVCFAGALTYTGIAIFLHGAKVTVTCGVLLETPDVVTEYGDCLWKTIKSFLGQNTPVKCWTDAKFDIVKKCLKTVLQEATTALEGADPSKYDCPLIKKSTKYLDLIKPITDVLKGVELVVAPAPSVQRSLDTCTSNAICFENSECPGPGNFCRGAMIGRCACERCVPGKQCNTDTDCGQLWKGCHPHLRVCICASAMLAQGTTWPHMCSSSCRAKKDCLGMTCYTGLCHCNTA